MVESAISDWITADHDHPCDRCAPQRFTFAKSAGNMRSSAATFDVCEIVNCQPSSEPTHAITASAMMI